MMVLMMDDDEEEKEEEKKSIYESVPRGGLHIYQKSFPL